MAEINLVPVRLVRGQTCALCSSFIFRKSYRSLQSETSAIYRKYLQQLDVKIEGLICSCCVNKINRLNKIDNDILTKMDILQAARRELIKELYESHYKETYPPMTEEQKNENACKYNVQS